MRNSNLKLPQSWNKESVGHDDDNDDDILKTMLNVTDDDLSNFHQSSYDIFVDPIPKVIDEQKRE
jgi:hypothetical protein